MHMPSHSCAAIGNRWKNSFARDAATGAARNDRARNLTYTGALNSDALLTPVTPAAGAIIQSGPSFHWPMDGVNFIYPATLVHWYLDASLSARELRRANEPCPNYSF
jgi:hypothetical protein